MLLGLIGALMMFAGDMTLYYTPDDYEHDGTLRPIMNIMKRLDRTRLYLGGMPGPIAAFVNCLGYYHIPLMMTSHVTAGSMCKGVR